MRSFEMREAVTGKLLGTMQCVDDVLPGAMVRRFRDGEVQLEPVRAEPARPSQAAHDERRGGRKKQQQQA